MREWQVWGSSNNSTNLHSHHIGSIFLLFAKGNCDSAKGKACCDLQGGGRAAHSSAAMCAPLSTYNDNDEHTAVRFTSTVSD